MQHTQKQLDSIRDNVRSGKQAQQADALRPIANPTMPDILPILTEEADGTEQLSVPVQGGTDRAVYRRPKGGVWVEVSNAIKNPLATFAGPANDAAVKVMQQGAALIRAAFPNDDPDQIVAVLERVFANLNTSGATMTPDAFYQGYRAARGD
jgi:hypothetical protein